MTSDRHKEQRVPRNHSDKLTFVKVDTCSLSCDGNSVLFIDPPSAGKSGDGMTHFLEYFQER